MNSLPDMAAGAAHAILFGVFIVSAMGKLAGCRNGSRIMCGKAVLDLTLALGAALAWSTPVAVVASVLAAAIGSLGWLRERLRNNPACNCFGVLSMQLSAWRNVARGAMLVCPLVILSLLAWRAGAAPGTGSATLAGAAAGLALVLAAVTFALAAHASARKAPPSGTFAKPPTDLAFAPGDHVGADRAGRALAMADLGRAGQPLAIIIISKGCTPCEELKDELSASAERFPFPLYLVSDEQAGAGDGSHFLFDSARTLRARAGIVGSPSMLLIDPASLRITGPVVAGAPHIRRALLERMLAAGAAGPAAMDARGARRA